MEKIEEPTVLFGKSKWIWAADATKKNSNVIMRRTFSFGQNKPPQRAFCRAACDTHYYLFVNGNAVVWNGGLNRSEKHAYYDEFDIASFLTKGDNIIVVFAQYYGNDGRDLVCSPRAGFIFECNDLDIYSDSSFMVYENEAFQTPRSTNCCYAGFNVNYDAAHEGPIQNVYDPAYNITQFKPATVLASYPDDNLGVVTLRPVPLEKFSAQPVIAKPKKTTNQFDGDTYIINLPREMRVTPYMEVAGNGQEVITITTDRTDCMGCFGDEVSTYKAHSVKYTTKPTLNIYEGMLPMVGSVLYFTMPRSVKVVKLGYRELGFNTTPTCAYQADTPELDKLFNKAVNTLYMCMGSTLMDTPERERTMWLGDASVEARALYLVYADAASLVKKVLEDVIEYSENSDILYSCVPGNVPVDIPSHGLIALGDYGIFGTYRNYTTDLEFFRVNYEKLVDYVMQWDMTEHGVALRDGTRRWYDNLYNVDEVLLENALYYNACSFLKELGAEVGNNDYEEDFDDRMSNIAEFIESTWDGLGYTTREDSYDDRANAFIALAGLIPDDRKGAVARLLSATINASPYMEWAVLTALSELGRRDMARTRFNMRYSSAANDEQTTLGEDFNGYGTRCQGYQSAVIFEAIELFGGISVKDGASKIKITPDFTAVKDFRTELQLASGTLDVRYKYSPTKVDIIIDNKTTAKVELEITPEHIGRAADRRTIVLNKGKNKFSV
ncbi:MAG: hypothetical protein K2K13_04140 [Clostridiales bacterium]|nr:hypothetical protein [Clostridiales bacterium]